MAGRIGPAPLWPARMTERSVGIARSARATELACCFHKSSGASSCWSAGVSASMPRCRSCAATRDHVRGPTRGLWTRTKVYTGHLLGDASWVSQAVAATHDGGSVANRARHCRTMTPHSVVAGCPAWGALVTPSGTTVFCGELGHIRFRRRVSPEPPRRHPAMDPQLKCLLNVNPDTL